MGASRSHRAVPNDGGGHAAPGGLLAQEDGACEQREHRSLLPAIGEYCAAIRHKRCPPQACRAVGLVAVGLLVLQLVLLKQLLQKQV